ncbi:MAG: hypothetical protein KAH54_07115 [Candidatus Sabulitectum sp.]|nr:hypothetical protein [Candidatus Sabulitectum sp.]
MNFIISAFLVFLFLLPSAFADIPDNTLNSDSCSYLRLMRLGHEYLVEVLYSETDSITNCFGYSIAGDSITYWILSIDHEGVHIT